MKVAKINKKTTSQKVKEWSIEGHVTNLKVVKQIVMNFGLLILHKQRY